MLILRETIYENFLVKLAHSGAVSFYCIMYSPRASSFLESPSAYTDIYSRLVHIQPHSAISVWFSLNWVVMFPTSRFVEHKKIHRSSAPEICA